jgi:uncharacterized damage-inducible protein DinB
MRATATFSVLTVLALTSSLGGQTREGLMGELLRDVNTAQMKIVGLAKAMPAAAYEWRPNKGVRSTAEVLMHVAADNYFIPALMGATPPAETGINGKEYSTAEAFEKRTMTREQIIAELEKSFDFLKASMNNTPDAKLEAPRESGKQGTNRGLWISATTHLHEHLGQLIAYARSNNVTPPWTK